MSSKHLTNSSPSSSSLLLGGARVLITGGGGFIGKRVRKLLEDYDVSVFSPSIEECDLTTIEGVKDAFSCNPDIVIHLAADVGGLGYLSDNSSKIFHNNLTMDMLVIKESCNKGVKRFIGVGSVNCYPSKSSPPYVEANIWEGLPHESVLGYGISKRISSLYCKMLSDSGILDASTLILEGVFGPGDNFEKGISRVIPANISRCIDAKNSGAESIKVWGSGKPVRDFLYVDDAARSILFVIDKVDSDSIINVSSGKPISIRELIECIADTVGFEGSIEWDSSKPDGQEIRFLSSKLISDLGFKVEKSLFEGIKDTVRWYNQSKMT